MHEGLINEDKIDLIKIKYCDDIKVDEDPKDEIEEQIENCFLFSWQLKRLKTDDE